MTQPPAWRRCMRFFGVDVPREVDEELHFHLEQKTRDLIADGMPPAAARAEARRQFGEVAEVRRLCESFGQHRERTIERRDYWTGWGHDLRYAVRMIVKTPMVTAIAVLSMALGIGANTAIFTVLDQVILRALPVDDPASLVRIRTTGAFYGSTNGSGAELSHPLYLDLQDQADVFAGSFGVQTFSGAANSGDRAEILRGELVTGTYFATLGVGASRGRLLGPDDDRVPDGHPVAVISHAYWQRGLAADPQVVGRSVTIANVPLTIVGVVEPGFNGTNLATATQVFVPMAMHAAITRDPGRLNDRRSRWLNVFGRLAAGVSPEQATARLEPLYRAIRAQELQEPGFARASAQMRQRFLEDNHLQIEAAPEGHTPVRREMQRPLWILMAIVSGVLLIACANVANLLLARAAVRQREIALRLSLGATRVRVVRQLLVETLLLALLGGAGGLAIAAVGAHLLLGLFIDPESASLIRATPDLRILLFTFGTASATGLIFGIVPAVQATRPALAPTLKAEAGSVLGGLHQRLRRALVVSQVALSLLLLIGAGLFLRSLTGVMSTDLGFSPDRLVMFGVDPGQAGYQGVRTKQFASDLLSTLRTTPGVSAAGFAGVPLLWGGWWGTSVTVEGYVPAADENVGARCNSVSPGYFEALGIPLLIGRSFTDGDFHVPGPAPDGADPSDGYRVAVASESFVSKYIDGNPLGRHVGFGSDPGTATPIEIVGVVKDAVYSGPLEQRQPQLYFPYLEQRAPDSAWFYVRATGDPEELLPALRHVTRDLAPDVPMINLRTMDAQLSRSLVNQRLVTGLSSVFGLLATTLAMVGLYGVMAYSVTRRTREIGVRIALGAPARLVAWLIVRDAMVLVVAGMALALPAAWWLSRYVRSELHGVTPTDPLAVATAVLALVAVAAVAALVPAARAARINPVIALRQD